MKILLKKILSKILWMILGIVLFLLLSFFLNPYRVVTFKIANKEELKKITEILEDKNIGYKYCLEVDDKYKKEITNILCNMRINEKEFNE